MVDEPVPAPPLAGKFFGGEIILYGIPLESPTRSVSFDGTPVQLTLASGLFVAVIYGYAFEGLCYRLDRTKVMIFKSDNDEEPAKGCGFEAPYKMWRITTKTRVMEFTPVVDDADKVILEANLPQNRTPNTYRMNAQLAHRNGRMSGG